MHRDSVAMIHDAYYADRQKFTGDIEYVKGLFCGVVKDSGPLYIIIDGLDEIEEHHRQLLLKTLLEVVDICGDIKFQLSSRKEHDILRILGTKVISLMLNENNLADIENYVETQGKEWCEELRGYGADDSVCDEINDELKR